MDKKVKNFMITVRKGVFATKNTLIANMRVYKLKYEKNRKSFCTACHIAIILKFCVKFGGKREKGVEPGLTYEMKCGII